MAAAPTADALRLTNALIGLNKRYQQAGAADRPGIAADMVTVASQRRYLLSRLVGTDNAAVLRLAVPDDVRATMPASIQALVEAHVELEGVLQVLYEDYQDRAVRRHYLHANGKRYALHFAGKPPRALSGSKVRVRAVQIGTELLLEAGSTTTSGAGTMMLVTSPALAYTLGAQSTLVLLVNFTDNTTQPFTATQIGNAVFGTNLQILDTSLNKYTGSVNDFFRENSFGHTSLSGDARGWYRMSIASTCETGAIATAAKAAASAAGVNLASYSRIVYVFPRLSCGWAGIGEVGGLPTQAWINGTLSPWAISHEMGHNFGLEHSHSYECATASVCSSGTTAEYGDTFDTMGNTNHAHYNSFQKERLLWLNYGSSPPIATATAGGSFSIEPYESQTGGNKALKVYAGTDAVSGLSRWYYVEYRQALGFDSFLSSLSGQNITAGVLVHAATEGDANSSRLLDATPDSFAYEWQDWPDAALTPGRSFIDASAGVTITTASVGGSAVVNVSYAAASCTRADPDVTISPTQGATVLPGTAVSYALTVTNRDSSACGASQFKLAEAVPSGWTANWGTTSLGVAAAGGSASTSLVVTSPSTASDGIYGFSAAAVNSVATGYANTASSSYVVGTAPTTTKRGGKKK